MDSIFIFIINGLLQLLIVGQQGTGLFRWSHFLFFRFSSLLRSDITTAKQLIPITTKTAATRCPFNIQALANLNSSCCAFSNRFLKAKLNTEFLN